MITGCRHPQEALELAMATAAALERRTRAPSPERLSPQLVRYDPATAQGDSAPNADSARLATVRRGE